MAFQGEYFLDRYGERQIRHTPPIRKLLEAEVPVGMGTDATRVSSYNPWLCLYWLTTGKTVGGLRMYEADNLLTREEALRLYTQGSAWFSNEESQKGAFLPNQLADFAVLSQDYFQVADEEIKNLYAVMTVVGGKIVYAAEQFASYDPPIVPISPAWSPVKHFGAYQHKKHFGHAACMGHSEKHKQDIWHGPLGFGSCMCWAF